MKKHYWILSLVVFIAFLIVWQLFGVSSRFSFFFASPTLVASSIWMNLLNGILLYATFITGIEAVCGFIIGIVLGTLVGFLLWYSDAAAHIAKPFVVILGAIPAFAFAPVIILWFGIGIPMKIALAALGVFLIALTQAYEGAKSINQEEYKLLKLYGASRWQVLQKVVFPSSLDWVLASMKLNVGFAILGAFIGEFISSNVGLGHFMLTAGSLYDIPSVFAGGFFLVLLSLFLNWGVSYIEKNRLKIVEMFA
jgi:NitT/TauT family transport system permease protein